MPPAREIRAFYGPQSIRIYQAFSHTIADRALLEGGLVPPFKLDRMTWIKPSFLWMMHRSGWASKPGQERVLAIAITREGFEWALQRSSLSSYDPAVHASHKDWKTAKQSSDVRVQWDPDRDLTMKRLNFRCIQIGLAGEAIRRYSQEWILSIEDVTDRARRIRSLAASGDIVSARLLLPNEVPYELPTELAARIGMTVREGPKPRS